MQKLCNIQIQDDEYCPNVVPNRPKPAFKPPREGYPNDMCNLDDYSGDRGSSSDEFPDAMAVIDVGKGTSQSIHVTLPAAVLSNTSGFVLIHRSFRSRSYTVLLTKA